MIASRCAQYSVVGAGCCFTVSLLGVADLHGMVAVVVAVGAPDWDSLQVAMQKIVEFATDPTTTFLIDYDDIKHLACYVR